MSQLSIIFRATQKKHEISFKLLLWRSLFFLYILTVLICAFFYYHPYYEKSFFFMTNISNSMLLVQCFSCIIFSMAAVRERQVSGKWKSAWEAFHSTTMTCNLVCAVLYWFQYLPCIANETVVKYYRSVGGAIMVIDDSGDDSILWIQHPNIYWWMAVSLHGVNALFVLLDVCFSKVAMKAWHLIVTFGVAAVIGLWCFMAHFIVKIRPNLKQVDVQLSTDEFNALSNPPELVDWWPYPKSLFVSIRYAPWFAAAYICSICLFFGILMALTKLRNRLTRSSNPKRDLEMRQIAKIN